MGQPSRCGSRQIKPKTFLIPGPLDPGSPYQFGVGGMKAEWPTCRRQGSPALMSDGKQRRSDFAERGSRHLGEHLLDEGPGIVEVWFPDLDLVPGLVTSRGSGLAGVRVVND